MRRRTGRSLFRNRVVLLLLLGAIFFTSTWFYYFQFASVNSQVQSQPNKIIATPQQNIKQENILAMTSSSNKESKAMQVGEEPSSKEEIKKERAQLDSDLSYKVVTFYYP